jgi:hypothetical protein
MRGLLGSGLTAGFLCLALAGSATAQTAPALSQADTRELIEAAKATAKATRETVTYVSVTPDLLHQILTKLDKLEGKLDKVENALKAQQGKRGDKPCDGAGIGGPGVMSPLPFLAYASLEKAALRSPVSEARPEGASPVP